MEQLLAALRQLDPLNDDHWTVQGDPKIEAVKQLAGQDVAVDRQAIVSAAPDLNRKSAEQPELLLMNKPAVTQSPTPSVEPEPEIASLPEELTARERAYDLMAGSEGVVRDLLEKQLSGRGLTAQESGLVIKNLSTEQLKILSAGLEDLGLAMNRAVTEMQAEIKQIKLNRAWVNMAINQVEPEQSNQDAIRAYLDNQQKTRLEKAGVRQRILGNLDLRELDHRSKLDQAMARKTERGMNRPQF